MTDPARRILLGRIVRSRGLKGDVIVRGDEDAIALIEEGEPYPVVLDGVTVTRTVCRVRDVRDGVAVGFEEVTDRDGADALRGAAIEVEPDRLTDPTPEAYLWEQIAGFRVVTVEGETVGRAVGRIVTGAHDVFIVDTPDHGEVLIPASPNVFKDVQGDRLVVALIPGLLELNES